MGINLLIAKSVHADNAAHFGGLITGLIIGSFSFFTHSSYKRIVVDLVLLTIFIGVFFSLSRYQVKYFNFYQSLFNTEEQFNEQSRGKHTDPEFLSIYKNTRADWDTTLSLLDSITYFPKRLEIDTARIREYIRLAKKVVDFRTIMLEHESFIYLDSIQYASQQMQDLPRPKYVPYFRLPKEKPDDPPSEEASKPVKVLYDSNWAEIPNPPAVYYRIAFKDSLDNWHGAVTDYYANGDIQMKGRYDHGKRDGVFIYYSDHKTYTSAGRYRNNFYYRKWEIFHDNGLLKSEIFYTDSYFLKNLWDIIGVQLVKDGNGTEVQTYSNGVIAITGDYHGGRKEGYWHGKHENGKMFFEENFYQGRLVRGRSFNNQGEIFNYDESSLFPIPEGGFQKFRKYLKDEASKITSKQDGMVRLSFQVTLTGEITDILIEKSASPELDAIAKQIVLNGPKWIPGKIHGQLGIEGQAYAELNFENYPNN